MTRRLFVVLLTFLSILTLGAIPKPKPELVKPVTPADEDLWGDFGAMVQDMRNHALATGDAFLSFDNPMARTIGYQAQSQWGKVTKEWHIRLTRLKGFHELEHTAPEVWAFIGGAEGVQTAAGRTALARKLSA